MSRGWHEEQPEPPPDLRLVPAALACWAGALIGLLGNHLAFWIGGGLIAGVISARRLAPRQLAGIGAAVAVGLCSMAMAGLRFHAADSDPLVQAGSRGSWADLSVTVDATPQSLPATFPAAAGEEAPSRWLVRCSAQQAIVAGKVWTPVDGVTVFGQGSAWAGVIPGEHLMVSGLLGPDTYAVLPAVLLTSRSDPVVSNRANRWQTVAARMRKTLANNAAGLSGDAPGLLSGFVVGDTNQISDALTADAKITGLTHLLAVSGSHFALICGAVVLLLRRAGPRPAAVGGAVVLLGLVILVGPGASVLRAAVMGAIALIALAIGRGRSALPALAAAVIVLLLVDSTLARSAGFALSVQATAGLVLVAPAWSTSLQRRGVPSGWADVLAVPMVASIVTAPVIAALSGSISLASVPANMLVAPVVAPALVIGVVCAVVGLWWTGGAGFLAHIDQPLLNWVGWVAHHLAAWSDATIPWPATVTGVLSLAGLLIGTLLALRHRKVRALVIAAAVGAGVIIVPAKVISVGWPAKGWVLTACEVGQGDGMVLATPDIPGGGVVVDAGPDPRLMDACLDRLGITTVPLVLLTHLHSDHIDGLAGVLQGRSVGAIGVGVDRGNIAGWQVVRELAAGRGIPIVSLPIGTRWASGGLSLTVLGPKSAFHGTDSDPNNDSVLTMAQVSGIRILMTGDMELSESAQLLASGADLRADVLEQPHHGSAKVQPEFIRAVAPRVSVIGVGLGNDYGQPNPTALSQLTSTGAVILRTDLEGDSCVAVQNGKLVTAFRGATLKASTAPASGDGS